jgi:hypothetical protein
VEEGKADEVSVSKVDEMGAQATKISVRQNMNEEQSAFLKSDPPGEFYINYNAE